LEFQGQRSNLGVVMCQVTDVGYNLTEHFGGDFGLPVIFVRTKFTLTTDHDWEWTTLWGSPYVDLHYTNARAGARFITVLTGTFPLSSQERTFTTGRAGVDWYNHIEPDKPLPIKPFVNFGISNGTVDRFYLPRPYTIIRPYQTLGGLGDGEVGATIVLRRGISAPHLPHIPHTPHIGLGGITAEGLEFGGSVYGLLPVGSQKVFSRLVAPGSAVVGDQDHGRYFYGQFETKGDSSIARDNGYSAWLEITRLRGLDLQISYTRSIHYATDTVGLVLKIDATSLIRFLTATGQ